ncbi:MAG: phosphate regulon sensor histidine kinase PhoR [Thiohalomonadales bacterium]
MSNPWVLEIWRMALLFTTALLLGWLLGFVHAAFTLALIIYLAWHIYNLYRLERWYYRRKKSQPPDAPGIWGEAFHHIYQLQKRNRKRKKRLSGILSRFKESTAAMPDATIVLSEHDHIEWFNKAAKQYLGLKTSQDVGQRIDNLIRQPRFVEYFSQGMFDEPLEFPSPLDASRSFALRVVPYARNQKLLIVRDITRLKRLERMRSDFVANVSHELRTPLTVISGYLENMLDDRDESHEYWFDSLQQMQGQATRMTRLVEDLLMLSRLEDERSSFIQGQVSVPTVLTTLIAEAQQLSGKKAHKISLNCETALNLQGSETELRSAFANLIFNAVHYTQEQGRIEVSWSRHNEHIILAVEDNGIGIPSYHLSRLTERFYRVDTGRSRDVGGTGLGLAIVRHVLDRHHAKLIIESQPGKGSIFRCVFPISLEIKVKGQ